MLNPVGAELSAVLTAGSRRGGLGGRGWARTPSGWWASGCGSMSESAGIGMCSQEPVVTPGRGGAGMCACLLGMEATGGGVGMPRAVGTGNVWVFQGWWTCWSCWALGVVVILGQQTLRYVGILGSLPRCVWESRQGLARRKRDHRLGDAWNAAGEVRGW